MFELGIISLCMINKGLLAIDNGLKDVILFIDLAQGEFFGF